MTAEHMVTTSVKRSLLVGLTALALASLYALSLLSAVDYDVTLFTAFGEEAAETRQYAEERLGEVFLRPHQGHDGKFFFVQANDPLLLEPEENAAVLDRPIYRSQRMLYPLIAGAGGLLSPDVVVWALLLVNLLAMGAGSWAVAHVAMAMGGSPWWGLAFVLNVGLVIEMNIDGAGIVSAAAAFGAVALLLKGRSAMAIVLLLLAVLAREAMLIAAVGSAWWLWRRDQRTEAVAAIAVPLSGIALWAIYLRWRIDWDVGVSQVEEIGFPFRGFLEAIESWMRSPADLAAGAAMIILFVLYVRRALLYRRLVGIAFLGFVALGLVFSKQVWLSYFDITRAVAPLITAFVLMVFLERPSSEATEPAHVHP